MPEQMKLMTVAELAPLVRRTVGGIRKKIERGEIVAQRAGRIYLIDRAEARRVYETMYPGWPVPMALAEEGR